MSLNPDNPPLQTTRVASATDLEAYRGAWRALALGAAMRSPEWLLVWWQHYAAPGDELCVLICHEPGGALVGLAPLYLETAGTRRTVRLLGSGDASTNHATWLAAAGFEERVSLAVAQFLLALQPAWHCVRFDAVDEDDTAINATMALLAANGCLVRRKSLHNCWGMALPPTWEEYLASLSRTQRKRCRRLNKLFLESGRVTVHRVTSPADFPRGFEILLQLHGARWGEPAKPLGLFSDQRFRGFHEAVALELLAQNQLLLVWLEYQGRPIAVEYQFIDKKTVSSYLAGMDTSVTELPPGNLAILASLQFAVSQGFDFFDFSRGDQPYKAHWGAAPALCHELRIWPDRVSGRLEHALWGLGNLAEAVKKSAVRWLKARVSAQFIEAWRRMHAKVTGRRRGPRKVGSPID